MPDDNSTQRRVLLLQLDGKIPNIALMRIAAHHKALGDSVELRRAGNITAVQRGLWDVPDRVYASAIFERTRPVADALRKVYPDALIGGTGVDIALTLEDHGISTTDQDYSIYPRWRQSIGFLQRGCRLRCPFCVVPRKEGAMREEQTVSELWRGDPYPKELILLDNDFFGNPSWRERIAEIRDGGFKVSFNQGINARFLDEETAEAIGSVDYRGDQMKARRIYTAWDNRKDEKRLMRGLELLVKSGVKPAHIMVYMLIGYWKGETHEDREHRRAELRAFGAVPYPMPFERTRELVGFQRWVIGAYDKGGVSWADWSAAGYRPERLKIRKSDRDQISMAL
jgi:hypothetical protein